jgi:4-hydroxy-tetrahydrodipicolinate synthase
MFDTDFIRGIVPPILTPIDENEMINEQKLREHVDFIIEGGVHGILAFGSNSEFYMVDEAEMERGIRIIVEVAAGRVPVFMGVGAIRTSQCIKYAKMGIAAGAKAVSVLQPMFLKPDNRELYAHFKAIADAIPSTPVLLYNNPGRVGYTLSADFVVNMANDVENIVGIKDSSGDMTLTAELIRRTRSTNFKVMGGKDTLLFGTLIHGGAGGVCTMANIYPKLVCSIYEKFKAGDISGALEAQYVMNPIRLSMDKASFPVATKTLANIAGLDVGDPYRPSLPTSGDTLKALQAAMDAAGKLE